MASKSITFAVRRWLTLGTLSFFVSVAAVQLSIGWAGVAHGQDAKAPSKEVAAQSQSQDQSSSQNMVLGRQYHPWGRFQPGSWTAVEVWTESFTAEGEVMDRTWSRTRTTLEAVSDEGLTLSVESSIDMGAQSIESPPQRLRKSWWGDPAAVVTIREVEPVEPYELSNQLVPVRRFQVEVATERTICRQVVDFSDEVAPFFLRRNVDCFDRSDQSLVYSTRLSTLGVGLPFRFQDRLLSVAYVQTSQKVEHGETVSLETFSSEVPGGVTSHTMKEMDESGRLVRRSILQLVDYSAIPASPEPPQASQPTDAPRATRPASSQADLPKDQISVARPPLPATIATGSTSTPRADRAASPTEKTSPGAGQTSRDKAPAAAPAERPDSARRAAGAQRNGWWGIWNRDRDRATRSARRSRS